MKTLAKISLLALGLAAAVIPSLTAATKADAADAKHPRLRALLQKRAAFRVHAAKKLGLTPEQVTQLKSKRTSTVAALKAIRHDATLTREQKKAKAHETLQAARDEMRSTLTPDQQAKVKQFRERVKARRERVKP